MMPARLAELGVGARAVIPPPDVPGNGTPCPVGEPGFDAGGKTWRFRARDRTSLSNCANGTPGTAVSFEDGPAVPFDNIKATRSTSLPTCRTSTASGVKLLMRIKKRAKKAKLMCVKKLAHRNLSTYY